MLIAQITDIHLGFEPDNPAEFNRKRLDQVLARLMAMDPKPDMLLATGDIVDRGDDASYRRLRNAFAQVDIPVWPAMGNHDDRANFAQHFPEIAQDGGFVQYVVETGPLRLIVIDTLEIGRHGGGFCETRAAWLTARLDEAPGRQTVIVMHHPPVEVGIEWMDMKASEDWALRFRDCIRGRTNIVAILTGHLHRPITCAWEGTILAICPSTAPQVALDLAPIDPEAPDNRPMIIADPPAYALHYWNGAQLVTHYDTADEHVMLAQFDAKMQGLVRDLIAERPSV